MTKSGQFSRCEFAAVSSLQKKTNITDSKEKNKGRFFQLSSTWADTALGYLHNPLPLNAAGAPTITRKICQKVPRESGWRQSRRLPRARSDRRFFTPTHIHFGRFPNPSRRIWREEMPRRHVILIGTITADWSHRTGRTQKLPVPQPLGLSEEGNGC